jgi:HSP20 family protein
MLMRTDPFRELDRLTQQVFGNAPGTWSRPTAMPMDAYRDGDQFVVCFDLPGVPSDAIELDVERNVLTVKAERRPINRDQVEMQVNERPLGVFSRQLFLGDTLDTDHIDATYEAGVLTLRIPIAEKAKPRRISIASSEGERKQIDAGQAVPTQTASTAQRSGPSPLWAPSRSPSRVSSSAMRARAAPSSSSRATIRAAASRFNPSSNSARIRVANTSWRRE